MYIGTPFDTNEKYVPSSDCVPGTMVQTVSASHVARETSALLAPDTKSARRHAGVLMQDPAAGAQPYELCGKAFETRIQTFEPGRGVGASDGTSVGTDVGGWVVVGTDVVGEGEGARPQSILKSSPRTVEQSEGFEEAGVHQLLIVQVFVQTNPCASQ